jgi:hypothetical protein
MVISGKYKQEKIQPHRSNNKKFTQLYSDEYSIHE